MVYAVVGPFGVGPGLLYDFPMVYNAIGLGRLLGDTDETNVLELLT